jgi:hypothetical protein
LISLPYGGFVHKVSTIGNYLSIDDIFLEVQIIEDLEHLRSCHFEQAKQKLLQTEIMLQQDEFTDERSISFSKVSGEDTSFLKFYPSDPNCSDWFGLTFENNDGYEYILFHLESKLMSLKKGDQIIFLFEDKSKLVFDIEKNGKHGNAPYDISNDVMIALMKSKIEKIKVTDKKKGVYEIFLPEIQFNSLTPILYDGNKQYFLKEESNFLLELMLDEYIQLNRRTGYLK